MLDAYLAAAGIAADSDGALFRTTGRSTGAAQRMGQPDAYRMIQRWARQAGIATKIGNHSLRATGITDYLTNSGTLEHAQQMANYSSPQSNLTITISGLQSFDGARICVDLSGC